MNPQTIYITLPDPDPYWWVQLLAFLGGYLLASVGMVMMPMIIDWFGDWRERRRENERLLRQAAIRRGFRAGWSNHDS